MVDDDLADDVAEALVGVGPDVLEPILEVLADVAAEFGTLTHDEVVKIVGAAISAASSASSTHYLDDRRAELEAAVRRALAGADWPPRAAP
jgi:hypothetical protein